MQIREAIPGAFVGLAAGLIAGGLAALVGQPLGWALVTMVALGLPLGALGGGFGLLVAAGRLPAGGSLPWRSTGSWGSRSPGWCTRSP
ncbi:hypothetical protein FXN61_23140 [Lentzea sp. PSKA42]|uniref:Major facilitator superfamily (MFS) profile domain-containing protein n=1 Tax=Lentzea indica TaxID=2604800 RepID=A0ABX1FKS0_9PSEU|nr:hypothetical protein [Lentzea indica]NKE59545.1 hypothetical protein [Lentzea indica]